ncbi:type I restriction enzyme S subunit [Rhodopirellula rubra]|uniref:Type I restriction enzyme S subunit n=1 Tax=Aporhodopirellula rubra TaxID=980271 RepID=A0A7W5DVX3_9BACT|nr:restriction endonuclease subunit S [Aporhodopirellula rubra]MBB3205515.1 type I restriction enzyme S subunit [Aporhodopirellula rubra]
MSQVRDKNVGYAVRKGYKHTEAGLIPDDWKCATLESVATLSSGTTPARASHDRYFSRGTIPWVKTMDLRNTYLVDTSERVTKLALRETSLSLNPPGTVLVAMYGGFQQIGRTGLLGIAATVNQAITAVQPRNNLLEPRYLLDTLNFRIDYWKTVASSSRKDPNITSRDIKAFPVPLPPLAEQEAIAEALSDVDATLNVLSRLIAKKRDLKQAAMQQLLTGQTRLSGFGTKQTGVQETAVGSVPCDWDVSSVGAEFEIQLGKMLDAEKNVGVPKYYLGNRAVQWGRIDVTELQTMPMSKTDLTKFRLIDGDLLVCEGGDVGRAAIWRSQLDECYFQKALHRLRARDNFNSRLMIAFLKRWSDRGILRNYVTQTSIAHMPKDKFETIPLPKPPQSEQTAIATVLSDMDAEIEKLEARLEKTQMLKQGMMQELLTGQTRLI